MKNLGVIGVGRVGLITAICFAEKGFEVFALDKDEEKIKKLKKGEIPFFEPHLQELLMKNRSRLHWISSYEEILQEATCLFICVGTPSKEDGSPDLSQVEEVARNIAKNLKSYKLLVEKSTVPVRTAEWIKKTIKLYLKENIHFDVASNPEFLREGTAVYDFTNADRIVLGVESEQANKILLDIYKDFNCPIIVTDIKTAEIIKHASNAFLAMKISFINMVADLCEEVGADVDVVSTAMGYDHRIGKEFLKAGVGYGGSCFPKDVKAFKKIGEEYQLDFSLLQCVENINQHRIDRFINKIKSALWTLNDKTFGIWGLAFKPNTDDVREAPSIKVSKRLIEDGAILKLYDPKAEDEFRKIFGENSKTIYVDSPYKAAEGAHAILIMTEWDEFRKIDFKKLKEKMITPIIIDGRNIFNCQKLSSLGFSYIPIGKPKCEF